MVVYSILVLGLLMIVQELEMINKHCAFLAFCVLVIYSILVLGLYDDAEIRSNK